MSSHGWCRSRVINESSTQWYIVTWAHPYPTHFPEDIPSHTLVSTTRDRFVPRTPSLTPDPAATKQCSPVCTLTVDASRVQCTFNMASSRMDNLLDKWGKTSPVRYVFVMRLETNWSLFPYNFYSIFSSQNFEVVSWKFIFSKWELFFFLNSFIQVRCSF